MNCPICDRTCTEIHREHFICQDCGHGMHTFDGDVAKWHAEHFRLEQKYAVGEVLADGSLTPEYHTAREGMSDARFQIMKPYLEGVGSLLDIGCGGGTLLRKLQCKVPEVCGMDLADDLLNECKRNKIEGIKSDFLTYEAYRNYDAVIAFHVLEHVRGIKLFMSKMCEIATKLVVVEVPCNRKHKERFFGHVQSFTARSFDRLMSSCHRPILELRTGTVGRRSRIAILGGK